MREKNSGTKKTKEQASPSSKNEILNVRLPDELILEIDEIVKKKIFNSRSEAIREFAREYVHEQEVHKEKENAKESERGGRRW